MIKSILESFLLLRTTLHQGLITSSTHTQNCINLKFLKYIGKQKLFRENRSDKFKFSF